MEKSVRAAHHFLTEQDVQKLIPHVRKGLKSIDLSVLNDKESQYCVYRYFRR